MATTPNETVITERPEGEKQREYPFGRVRDRKSPIFKFVVIGGIALVIVGVVAWWIYASRWESTDDAQVDAHIYAISARVSGQVMKVNVARYKQLVEKDEVSKQQYDQAFAAAKAAAATVDATRAAVSSAQQQIAQARSKIIQAQSTLRSANTAPQQIRNSQARLASAEAQVQKAQANVNQAKLNLQYTKIIAPVDGVVGRKSVEAGQNVQPGQQLMSLVALNDVWVTANFKETQLKHMKPGQESRIKVDANGREYRGHVDSIGGASGARFSLLPPENATGNYVKVVQRIPVKIVLESNENSDHALRAGMSVEARVKVK